MICKYAKIFCSAKATHIFSAKNIRILCIESAKTVNEMTLNKLIKLTMLWTTGPWFPKPEYPEKNYRTFCCRIWHLTCDSRSGTSGERSYTVNSRYLEFQGTVWNTSRYPYLDISDFQNWGKIIRTTTFNKFICNWTLEDRAVSKILWKRGEIAP